MQAACPRADDVLGGPALDDRDVDPRQRQLAGQHQPRRTGPDDDHRVVAQRHIGLGRAHGQLAAAAAVGATGPPVGTSRTTIELTAMLTATAAMTAT